ncbi:zinc-binding dehydrogenase [Rhodococcus sp. ARC_M12]|uniref:zinc-binding dehydrogenase n=1 Tax=Rhodococcus sp. ARC_M12 TaxID=2928854 RepID=UPI001FB1CD3A|nr:zinc-binding dehydrogenase [Rhodococcus sp. ARC_M12]MCJ0980363.1 zinc-binding dehydrogenase [Rhodococcus sp. ARC_M12]
MRTDEVHSARDLMTAIVTTGAGGYDTLVVSEVPTPVPGPGEVLVRVLAAGMNNTEINTRVGWYSDGGWNDATPFPLIQGTDCCGVVCAGAGTEESIVGRRVLVRSCMRVDGFSSGETRWLGSDMDGAFAQFVVVPASEVFVVDCDWTDAELATIPCAYGTAENMIARAGLRRGSTVLVTGASGGVGSAAVQLAARRGARVIGVASRAKHDQLRELGVDEVYARDADLVGTLGTHSVDVVIDNVAGDGFGPLLDLLVRGGTYVSSGAIAGPLVALDLRTMYLNDLTLLGCTAWNEEVFPNLVSYIEAGEIRPLLAESFPLEQIAAAQQRFLEKDHVGKFVLVPPVVLDQA